MHRRVHRTHDSQSTRWRRDSDMISMNQRLLKHRIAQLKHERILPSSTFRFYQAFTFAGAIMVMTAIIFYLQQSNAVMLFVSYVILFVTLVAFCLYALRAHMHDARINDKIKKNYELLLESEQQ